MKNIKAYEVYYRTSGNSTSDFVLVGENETIEEALSKKDRNFNVDISWCRIMSKKEIPLSSVKIKDLSITEFLMINQ